MKTDQSFTVANLLRKAFCSERCYNTQPLPDLGLGTIVNYKWRKAMSALTDAMASAITELKNLRGGLNVEEVVTQVHAVVDPAVADLIAQINAIHAIEADSATKLNDVTTAVTQFTEAFAPATNPTPAPEPTPEPTAVPTA